MQRPGHDGDPKAIPLRHPERAERPVRSRESQHEVAQRVRNRLGECLGYARRQRDAKRVAEPASVLDRAPPLTPCYPQQKHAPLRGESGEPPRCLGGVCRSLSDLVG
jgi:hypothetical protein